MYQSIRVLARNTRENSTHTTNNFTPMSPSAILISQTRPRAYQDLDTFLSTQGGCEYTLCSHVTYRLNCQNQRKGGQWELVVKQEQGETIVPMTTLKGERSCCLTFRVKGISGYAVLHMTRDGIEMYKWSRPVKVVARNEDGVVPTSWKIDKSRGRKRQENKERKTRERSSTISKKCLTPPRLEFSSLKILKDEEETDVVDIWPEQALDSLLESEYNLPSPLPLEVTPVLKRKYFETEFDSAQDDLQQLKRQKTFYCSQ